MNPDEHTLENYGNTMDAHHTTRNLLTMFKKTQSKQNELKMLQQIE